MEKYQSFKFLISCSALLAIAACSPKIDNRGYTAEANWKEQVVEGKTTKDEVMAALGSPSAQSTFGQETWYYISERKEGYVFLKPDVVAQNVVQIEFSDAGVVDSVKTYDKSNSQDVSMASRVTPTEGHTYGFFEQLLGNIGRFNKPAGSSDSNAPGRKPSS